MICINTPIDANFEFDIFMVMGTKPKIAELQWWFSTGNNYVED